ncbi:MAG TPA: discoidin domain-containing protein [Polyangiaceae bacterium]|nr:discoidin domain-containing protein [Polyangiaceae bacterium]
MVATSGVNDGPKTQESTRQARFRALAARFREWVTRRDAIAEAQRNDAALERPRRALALSRNAARAGDRLLDPPDGSRQQPELAMPLYREAALWLLPALVPELEENGSLAERLTRAEELAAPDRKAWLTANPAPPELCATSADFNARPREAQIGGARACQRWLEIFLAALTSEQEPLLRLRLERAMRASLVLAVSTALVWLLVWATVSLTRGPDLAAGKPWRTSSTGAVCTPAAETCGGVKTRIFFHTTEEEKPWFELDLLKATPVARVEVDNRTDSETDRAVPLRVELSLDGQRFWTVAETDEPFTTWTASFTKQPARYVRLTVMRRSILHLERVSVRP